ncbi:lysM domain receptor-like kinase 4 [Salvia hispanica]|uniref:lysM domain receptor-like kinase 4 n=1 Tax=Salvia hispanica TaxID=49212 RepID=UPI002009CF39|nr:lysM domain receptor-like kinase 4 [Salvia hispanica]
MAQQNYSGAAIYRCNGNEATMLSESLHTCNGQFSSCRAFLIFTAKSPYVTVAAVANLTSSDQAEISRINNITASRVLPEGQEVVVPVECSCSGRSYQATTTYQIRPGETYFLIADKTFKGLSTCDALKHANMYRETSLLPGQKLRVPLRCACPTAEQADAGTKFLLTYLVGHGDTLLGLSKRFNVSAVSVYVANHFHDEFAEIEPFTTILIPLPSEPSHSLATSRKRSVTTSPPLPPPVSLKSQPKRAPMIVGITAGAFFLLISLLVLLFLSWKKRAQVADGRRRNATSPQDLILEIAGIHRALKAYKFSEIKKATRNFGSRSRIKDHEYRGTFKREVLAVKKSSGNAEYEVKMLYKMNHFNIVRLHGFCQDKDDLYLVYEYMANGSLRDWLNRRGSQHTKSWNQRMRIALDVANGLLYLHNFANPAYVHNDVTSSNVLLDGNLRAKIANFSLAKEANCSDTKRVVGTRGYMAPECLGAGPVTPKVDVYAFGVVLLELITDEFPVFEQDGGGRLLSTTIAALMESLNAETDLCSLIASGLAGNSGTKYALQVVKLSLSCLTQDPSDRPDMVEVVSILQKMYSIIHTPH